MSKRVRLSLLATPRCSQPQQVSRTSLQRQTIWTPALTTTTHANDKSIRPSCRSFSSTSASRVGVQRMAGRGRQKAQPSMSVQQKQIMTEMQSSGEILNYTGLLPDTFVPPTGAKVPSLTSDFDGRKKLAWYRLKSWLGVMQSRFVAFWFVKPRLKLEVRKTPRVAKQLYEEMYTAFADGRIEAIEEKLAPGLRASLRNRIAQRAPNVSPRWKLHKYLESPVCVSFKFGLPDMNGPNTSRTGIMQAVVRIRSQQSLLHVRPERVKDPKTRQQVVVEVPVDRDGNEIKGFDQEAEEKKNMKSITEYFVIERLLIKGRLGSWRAWGTTEETDLAKLRKAEREKTRALLGEDRA